MTANVLMITGIEGAANCAAAMAKQLGLEVEVAENRKAAIALLRRKEYSVVIVDDTLAECDPAGAELIWKQLGLAIPLQVNFALAGAARLVREIKAAINRRELEQRVARRAATVTIENELKSTVAGLLLQSQLALAESRVAPQIEDKLKLVVELAGNLRQQLAEGTQAN